MSKRLLNLCLTALLSVVSTAAWALSDVNGVYQIGTAADLEEFAALVNGENPFANAELTADIDRGMGGTMIGTAESKYQGTFDGKGHTIKINMYPEEQDAALFQYTGFGAIIQNLKVTGTITTSSKFAAGLVACNNGIIRGCYIDVTINSSVAGDATHGGIVARGFGGTTVENCLAKVTILGETTQNCGGVVGWAENRTNIVNCLVVSDGSTLDLSTGLSGNISRNPGNLKTIDVETYNADPYANRPAGATYNNYVTQQWGDNVATTVVPLEELADGRICYQLNNDQSRIAWVQEIGVDPFPVPAAFGSGKQVFASAATGCNGLAEGELTFSNTGTDQAAKHQFDKYGVCTVCGCFDFHYFEDAGKFDPVDRSVLIGSAEDIDKVEGWNRIANGFRLNMKLTSDIEYKAEPGKYIFNPSDWIDGNFNGQGHTMTIEMTDMGEKAALFPEMNGNVENLILHGTITANAVRWGSVSGNARMALVRNVYSDIDFTSTVAGDNTAGGMFGWTGDREKHVENCIYAGDINLPESAPFVRIGGFAGWTATKTYYTNCAVLGNIIGAGDQSMQSSTENSGNIARNWGSIVCENCYVVNPITGRDIADQDKYTHFENEAGIASGELAFLLNGSQSGVDRFYQVIGTDPEPMPFKKEGGLVYSTAASYSCDGKPQGGGGYSNDPSGEAIIPPHTFEDGWCVVCGQFDEKYLTPVDGWYEISNGTELAWWLVYANAHSDACARLTDDIDMYEGMDRYVSVQKYVGTFDGQGHTISNFVLETNGNYQGLFGTICDGAEIKNLILDESCSVSGSAFCGGIVGGTNGTGDIYISNVGFEGTVTTTNQNAAGLVGVDDGGSMNMHIANCWVIGTINGGRESGAICGYSNAASEVINCWAAITIPQAGIYDCDSFTRGSAKVINCYEADIEGVDTNKQQHYRSMAADRKCNALPLEDITSGALCYKLNGKQFREPVWYQTIEVDEHPYPFAEEHGVVVAGAEQYFSMADESDLSGIASAIQEYEKNAAEEIVATQSLLDKLEAFINALTETEGIEAFADALDSVQVTKATVAENAAIYKAYIDKCEEVKAFLASNNTFSGAMRDALEAYLSETEEPSEDNPLGTYEYIVENHTATAEEIKAETERVEKWLADAIASDYAAGSDISKLIPNYDFSKKNESWTGGFANDFVTVQDAEGNNISGVEAWNVTGDMFQTVEGMKPGYYLIGTSAAFRPSNNRYGTNYAAGIYANGIFNYFPAAIEDYVAVEDAKDGENCNLTIKSAYDMSVYTDDFSTSDAQAEELGASLKGYVVQGPTGMAIAAKAGRYPVYTIARVGEDGQLTIGIKNPGTKYSNDWTGWSGLKVTYCGEEAESVGAALDVVLQNMSARAQTVIDYEYNVEIPAAGPNFPAALRDQLEAAVGKIEAASTVEEKAAIAAEISDLFQKIYEGKRAYIAMYNKAELADAIIVGDLARIVKDEETGEWSDMGETVLAADHDALYKASDALLGGYFDGSFSTEEALKMEAMNAVADIIPAQDEDGYYLIGTTKQFVAYRAIASDVDRYASGKLTADIDMAGIAMLPIGHNRGENAQHIFSGVFDGQGHALTNVFIDDARIQSDGYAEPATLFYELQNATVKNFKLTGEMYTSHQFSGPVTRWMSGKSTIDNCEIAVAMHFAANLAGDASSGGMIGYNSSANSVISNCLVNSTLIGDSEGPIWYVGGMAGWSSTALTVKNCLITSKYENVGADGDNSQTISRGAAPSVSNVYVSQFFRGQQGTLTTPEQMASGELTWKLNGSQGDEPVWFQTLGVDATPHLFGGDAVYLYAGKYTNEKPNIQLNAFAYNLDAKLSGSNVVVSFNLNAEAEAAKIEFTNGYTQDVPAEELAAGAHSVTVAASNLGDDPTSQNFKIAVTGKGSLDVIKMGDVFKVWGPYGIAVNNNPASKNFGQVLIAEAYPSEPETGYMSSHKPGGIYAFDPNFQPINSADGTPGYYGGLPIKGEEPLVIAGTYKYDLKDLRFTEDGRLFVARASGTSNSSVWEINPDDLDEPWKPVFTGGELDEATGITYVGEEEQNRMALSLAFEGKGEDLKMYVLGGQRSNGDYNFTDYNCSIYNLGTAKEWAGAPSASFEPLNGVYTKSPVDVGIREDGQGGLWFIQRRNDVSADIPAIKHFNAEGKEDYSNISSNAVGDRIAVTTNGNYLAIPTANGTIVLYETNYVPMENGRIFLNAKRTINVGESRITAMAFDYADNLYVASASTETFTRYTVPTDNKLVVTPGNGIGLGGPTGDLNGDGKVDIADAVTILNFMADGSNDPKADLNGDGKVDIADFVTVLNIMAQ